MCFVSPDVAFYKHYLFYPYDSFFIINIFYFTFSLDFTPGLQSAFYTDRSVHLYQLFQDIQPPNLPVMKESTQSAFE